MLETWSTRTEADLRREFAWKVQERYNIGADCSDRHPATRLAMIHVDHSGRPQELTFGDLTRGSNRLANALRARGIGAGERVGGNDPTELVVRPAEDADLEPELALDRPLDLA